MDLQNQVTTHLLKEMLSMLAKEINNWHRSLLWVSVFGEIVFCFLFVLPHVSK